MWSPAHGCGGNGTCQHDRISQAQALATTTAACLSHGAMSMAMADQRVAEVEAALDKARGRTEMARALAALPEGGAGGDEDIVDVSEPYDAALHEAPPRPAAATVPAANLHPR